MFTHEQIWRVIDRLAEREKLSLSALAQKADLSPSIFNRSKRFRKDGQQRWPSTESLADVLSATATDPSELGSLLSARTPMPQRLPRMPLDAFGPDHLDVSGCPAGETWTREPFTERGDPDSIALTVGNDDLLPVFRRGDVLIASPSQRPAVGQRLVLVLRGGEVRVRELSGRQRRDLQFRPVNAEGPEEQIARRDIRWLYRIRWCQY